MQTGRCRARLAAACGAEGAAGFTHSARRPAEGTRARQYFLSPFWKWTRKVLYFRSHTRQVLSVCVRYWYRGYIITLTFAYWHWKCDSCAAWTDIYYFRLPLTFVEAESLGSVFKVLFGPSTVKAKLGTCGIGARCSSAHFRRIDPLNLSKLIPCS